ncbi:MAG: hypothetical protein II013_02040 [Lachnobacterium sp.]|nr:hypothetical protein [Lachnobacterium sp.]
MKKTQKASVTVFASLSFMLILAVSFSLLEAARITEMKKVTRMNSDAVLESIFAEYNTPLYKKYGLLGYWADERKEKISFDSTMSKIEDYTNKNLNNSPNFKGRLPLDLIKINSCEASVEKYLLMTDGEGRAFTEAIVEKEKRGLPKTLINEAKEKFKSVDAKNSQEKTHKDLDDADEAIDNPKEYAKKHNISLKKDDENSDSFNNSSNVLDSQNGDKSENPIKVIKELKQKGILEIVLENPEDLSKKEINDQNLLSKRDKQRGNINVSSGGFVVDKVALVHYFSKYFSTYRNPRKDAGIQYEQEYIIAGKKDDISNLKSAVNKILISRIASNMVSIYKDKAKMAQIEALADTLSVITLSPEIMQCIKIGLITAWAYGESILDLRTLMSGGKISVVKSPEEWTLGLSGIGALTNKSFKAKECKKGLKYEEFLAILIALKSEKETTMHAMDIIEQNIRQEKGYEKFKLDNVVLEAKVDYKYQINTVFLGFVDLKTDKINSLEINNSATYSYLKNVIKSNKKN